MQILELEEITRNYLDELEVLSNTQNLGQRYSLINVNVKDIDLRGLDLGLFDFEVNNISIDGCTLDRKSLEYLYFNGRRNFQKIIIQNEDLSPHFIINEEIGIAFQNGFYLESINLEGAHFIKCKLHKAIFRDCNLSNVKLSDCTNLDTASAVSCKQEGINIIFKDYYEPKSSLTKRFFHHIYAFVSFKFLTNLLGDSY